MRSRGGPDKTVNWFGSTDVEREYSYVPDAMRIAVEIGARPFIRTQIGGATRLDPPLGHISVEGQHRKAAGAMPPQMI
jgi:hypothetical protein